MTKEVEKKVCHFCESSYKLMYDYELTNGHPRFCAFCGEESYDEKNEELDFEDDAEES